MSNEIHSQSVIEQGAQLGDNITIGPFCHVGSDVVLGDGARLLSHVNLQGSTRVGKNSIIYPFASVGSLPQDLKYHGEKSELVIGDNCQIREGVTINTGTEAGGNLTRIGDNCVFLANSHVAHDCIFGDNIIASNGALIAGHCVVGDHVIFGGGCAIHQFSRIGSHSFIGGMAAVENDVVPYGMAMGNRARLCGLNLVGMKRAGIDHESIHGIRTLFKKLFDGTAPVHERAESLRVDASDKYIIEVLDFVLTDSNRALCVPEAND